MAGDQNKFQIAMTHARRFSQQGDWANATKAYRFALAEFPNDESAIIGFGEANLAAGQADMAWKAFQQALKINPGNYHALNHIGQIQEQAGQVEAAAETYLRIGNILSAKDNLDAAVDYWLRATQLVPDHIDAHHNLAQALAEQGQLRQAARQLLTLAATYQQRNDRERARLQIEAARELLPDEPAMADVLEALEQGLPITPDAIGDTPPPEPVAEFIEEFAGEELLSEEDPFAAPEEESSAPTAGLVETAHHNAIAELANVIFEDEPPAAHTTLPPEQVNLLIVQAIDLQSRSELDQAIKNYRQVIQAGAGRPALYFNLGMLYKQQGQFDEAAKMFKMAAQDKVYGVSAQFALGQTYSGANRGELAVRHFLEALRLVDLQTVRGDKATQLARVYDSLSEKITGHGSAPQIKGFITALEKFFASPTWEKRVYEARQRMNSIAENGSIMSLAEFLETPETEIVITAMALTAEYIKRNLLLTASEECLRSIQKAPTYLPLHTRLAEIMLKQEHLDDAVTKYLYVARVYQMRDQVDQAISTYQKILALAPMDVTVRAKLIDLYTANNHLDLALDQYLILADSYYQLAQVDRALEKYNEALRLANQLPQAGTWRVEVLNRMGDIYSQRFDWARATSAFEELYKINPNDERIQRQLIDLYYKRGKGAQAAGILDSLLTSYRQSNQQARSVELLREMVSLHPEDMALRQRLAVAFTQVGRRREAIAEYDALGEMQLENGLRDQAAQTIQAIITLGPDDVEGYRRLLAQIKGGTV